MDPLKQEKIKRFLDDKTMSETIREVLTKSFLKIKGEDDVQLLAASMIAVQKLEDGFKELVRLSRSENEPEKRLHQPGL